MEEIWKDIPGYEGLYQATIVGKIKSLERINLQGKRQNERILKTQFGRYETVTLFDFKGNRHKTSVHRVIALTFIPNPLNKPQVNHIDGNKHNNLVCNLEWCTGSENMIHCYENNLQRKTSKAII